MADEKAGGARNLLDSIRDAYRQEIEGAEKSADPNIESPEGGTDEHDDGTKTPIEDGKRDPNIEADDEETPTQQQARAEGWMPLEEWKEAGNDPDMWKPAGAFLADGEVRKELRGLKRAVKKRDKVIDGLVKERDITYKAGYDQALKDLKRQRDQAAEEGDIKRVMELSDEMADIRAKQTPPALEPDDEDTESGEPLSQTEQQEVKKWVTRNPWYVMDRQLGAYADVVATQYLEDNEGADAHEALQHAERIVRQQFPSRFKGTPRTRAATDSGTPNKQQPNNPEPRVLQPRELLTMENGEYVYGIYKNFKAANMFVTDKNPTGGLKKTYSEWAKSIGAVKV